MDYEKMLSAITEAVGLRQLMATLESKMLNIEASIANNEKEISKRQSLEQANQKLTGERAEMKNQLTSHAAELKKRMDILNKAGVELPITGATSGGVVSL